MTVIQLLDTVRGTYERTIHVAYLTRFPLIDHSFHMTPHVLK